MKNLFFLFISLTLITIEGNAQGMGVNTTGAAPDPSAMLDVESTTSGFLPPRMTSAERDVISSPAEGLHIYNTDTKCVNIYSGSYWMELCGPCIPQPTTANAGPDQTDLDSPAILAANAPVSGTGEWVIIIGGDGDEFADASDPGTIFNGDAGETYVLQWEITTLCGSSTDEVTISFEASCSAPFVDPRDGKTYGSVLIGTQCWMNENLGYLPTVYGPGSGSVSAQHFYVYGYNGSDVSAAKATSNYITYGALYNWPAAMAGSSTSISNPSGVQGICPEGWHLPSDAEWCQMEAHLGISSPCSTTGWRGTDQGTQLRINTWGGTNSSGFTGLPAGHRSSAGSFSNIGADGFFWNATEFNSSIAYSRALNSGQPGVLRNVDMKDIGFSVRCVKN